MIFSCCKAAVADSIPFIKSGRKQLSAQYSHPTTPDTDNMTPFNFGTGELVKHIKSFIPRVSDRIAVSMVNRHTASSAMSRANIIDIHLMKIGDVINKKYFSASSQARPSLLIYSNSVMASAEGIHVLKPYIFEANDIFMG